MAQITDHPETATDSNGVAPKIIPTALVPREHELAQYNGLGMPLPPPVWQEPSASGGMNLTKLFHAFRRRWLLALFVGLVLAIPAALAAWLLFPSTFKVQSLLKFDNVENYLAQTGYTDQMRVKGFRETQLQLVESTLLLTSALREPGIADLPMLKAEQEPISFLQESLTVFSPKESDLMVIQMSGEYPEQMVKIVRAITKVYLDHAGSSARAERNRKMELLRRQVDENKEEIRRRRVSMHELAKTLGAATNEQVANQAGMLRGEIQMKETQLSQLQRELGAAKDLWAYLQEKADRIAKGEFPEALINDAVNKDPQIIELRKQISEVERAYNYERSVVKQRNAPSVARLAAQVAGLKEQEDALRAQIRAAVEAKMTYGANDAHPEMDLHAVARKADRLLKEVEEAEKELAEKREQHLKLTQSNAELEMRALEIKDLDRANAELANRLSTSEVELRLPPPVTRIEDADMPEGAALTYRIVITGFLGVVCFSLGVIGVVMLEYTKQRVSTLADVGYGGLGIRVLGTVPNLARLARSKNGSADAAVSGILAESIDSVRTMLLSNRLPDAPRVILVTSAGEHEGKTTVATHLAASLARAGRRTLLVDGDLRQPSVHTLFDMPLSAGLSEVVRGEAQADAVLHPAQVDGMWLLLAGQCDHRAIAGLAKEPAEALFNKLRSEFDFIVVDTGPVLTFADTMLMGSHADAAVLTILRDVSQIPSVYEARERLESVGVPVLGAVVGGVTNKTSRAYTMITTN